MTNNKLEILFYKRAKIAGHSTTYFLRWYNKRRRYVMWLEFMGLMETAYLSRSLRHD